MSARVAAVPFADFPALVRSTRLPDRVGEVRVLPASRLGDRPAPATVCTGIAELDALTGGLPRGALTEVYGPASSGRTSVLLSLMAEMTRREEVCALVDASDSFDPHSGAAAGIDLRRLLWVRCWQKRSNEHQRRRSGAFRVEQRPSAMDALEQALKATDLLLQGGGFGLVAVDLASITPAAARRVPLTSWFRFRRVVENTSTVLLVLEQEPYAKTCASLVVKLSGVKREQTVTAEAPPHARIFAGFDIDATVLRSAAQGKKPNRSVGAHWKSTTMWACSGS
jgi:hypothetical protein